MNPCIDLDSHRQEVLQRIGAHKYERRPDGAILLPAMGILIGGSWITEVNGCDREVTPNIIPDEGLDDLLDVWLGNGTQSATWYIAPFSQNMTPGASLTAADFTADTTEFTNYDEAARVTWADDAVSGQAITNAAVKADFTMSSGGGTIYGAGLLSVSTKSAVTGKLAAATRFGSSRTLAEADILTVQYTLSAAST